mgnify:CR=1 FL=1
MPGGKPAVSLPIFSAEVSSALRTAALNAAATAAGLALHPEDPTRLALSELARFRGVRRRQELLYDSAQLKVVEDFGHFGQALTLTAEQQQREEQE